ncbi:Cytochrome P450 monooxygenase [Drechslerella dactyloides]|uniref:Cytochrome P450 monooxygenase n=1 Tax=Drechslerella dactyloides TaxID=74499 RepID=A0AAD6NLR8_DREDA|nr:Cytochrome P450 monooxygenase [Drechslerella dactyloides]
MQHSLAAAGDMAAQILSLPPLTLLGYAFAGLAASAAGYVVVYVPLRFLYRITLHPLAKVPGPRWMLISGYVSNVYWNATGDRQGTSLFWLKRWHEQYGPMVRTAEDVVHIDDIDAYNQIFKVGTKFPKTARFYNHPSTKHSLLDITDFHEAHLRRSALAPYFSKQAVRKLQDLIQAKVSRFLERLVDSGRSNTTVNLTRGFRCLACDIVTGYSYEQCFDALEDPDFSPTWLLAFESLVKSTAFQAVFPWFFAALGWFFQTFMSRGSIRAISPMMAQMLDFSDVCRDAVLRQKARWNAGETEMTSIFQQLFEGDEKKGRKRATDDELAADALLTVSAGMDTTGHTLTLASYYLVKNPDVQARLLAELKTVMPTPTFPVTEETLDQLPLLKSVQQAVIKETLRFSHGVPGPLPRDVPPTGATLSGHHLPAGTVTLNSHYIYHTNASVFTNPMKWAPDRWLVPDTREMDRYFMPFSRGARMCVGMNLAMAELTITVARMVRRVEVSFAEGFTDADMEWRSLFVAVQNGFLTVNIKERED